MIPMLRAHNRELETVVSIDLMDMATAPRTRTIVREVARNDEAYLELLWSLALHEANPSAGLTK
jgi:hypothetical protein